MRIIYNSTKILINKDYIQKAGLYFSRIIATERHNFIVWSPIITMLGIYIYFSRFVDISIKNTSIIFLINLFLFFVTKKHSILKIIFTVSLLLILGFLCSSIRVNLMEYQTISKKIYNVTLEAKIDKIINSHWGKKIIFSDIKTEQRYSLPKKIKLTMRGKKSEFLLQNNKISQNNKVTQFAPEINIADTVKFRAILEPIGKPVYVNSFDPRFFAFFSEIGAKGYILSDMEIIKKDNNFSFTRTFENIRNYINNRIMQIVPNTPGAMSKALITGDVSGIDKQSMEQIRAAGLAHLLAISGMNLALVAGMSFVMLRYMLLFFPKISFKMEVKKIAAFFAIIISFLYLAISGMEVSAERAFIMTSVFLLAIIIDRNINPLRSLALAAFIIILWRPESIFYPGFQMSFAAVLALISSFAKFAAYIAARTQNGIISKFFWYFIGVVVSSFIAGLATTPFALYHFNNYSHYSLLANLIAVPLNSLVVMPAGFIGMIFMPFGLDVLLFKIMGYGNYLTLEWARYIAALPNAVSYVPQMPIMVFGLFIFTLLWFCLWQTHIKFIAIITLCIGVAIHALNKNPDIILSPKDQLFAVRSKNGKLLFSSGNKISNEKLIWLNKSGQTEFKSLSTESKSLSLDSSENVKCDIFGCVYNKNNYQVSFIYHPLIIDFECKRADIVINYTDILANCPAKKVINSKDLQKAGGYAIYLGKDIEIVTIAKNEEKQVWQNSSF